MTSQLPNYQYIRIIGHGTFGYVFEAFDRTNQKKVAIKRIHKLSRILSREYEILFKLKGMNNIVQIEDIFLSQTDEGQYVQNIVFEFKDHSLESIISQALKNRCVLQSDIIKKLAFQLFNGLDNMHSQGIVHRDLKPENILIDKNYYLEICDFGSAKVIDQSGQNTPYVVSQYYRAPELILSHTDYGASIDIWAAGCILAELANLQVLFDGSNEGDQLYQIFQIIGSPPSQIMHQLFSQINYSYEIQKRFIGFEGYSSDKWKQLFFHLPDHELFVDLLQKLLKIDRDQRLTASQALKHPYFH